MADLQWHTTVRRVGNSLAILVPAKIAKALALHQGDQVDVRLERPDDEPVGVLGHLAATRFERREEGFWDA